MFELLIIVLTLLLFCSHEISAMQSAQWNADFFHTGSVAPFGATMNTNSSIACASFALDNNCKSFKLWNVLCQCVSHSKLIITNPDHGNSSKIWVEHETFKNLPLHFVGISGLGMGIYDVTFTDPITFYCTRPGETDWLRPFIYLREKRTFAFITKSGDLYHWKLGSSTTTKIDAGVTIPTGFFASQNNVLFIIYPKAGDRFAQAHALYGGTTYKKLALLPWGFSQLCVSFSSVSDDEVYLIGGAHNIAPSGFNPMMDLINGIYKMVLSDGSLTFMTSFPAGIVGLIEHSCASFEYEGNPAVFVTAGRKGSPDYYSMGLNPDSFVYLINDNVVFKLDSASLSSELKEPTLAFVPPYMYRAGGMSNGNANYKVYRILPAHNQDWELVTSNIEFELRSYGALVPIN